MLHVLLLFVSFLLIEQRRKIMKTLENGEINKLRPQSKTASTTYNNSPTHIHNNELDGIKQQPFPTSF